MNLIKNNTDRSEGQETSEKNTAYNIGTSYSFKNGIFGSTSVNRTRFQDKLTIRGYETTFLRTAIGRGIGRVSVQANGEGGYYHDLITPTGTQKEKKAWLGAGAYAYFNPSPNQRYSFYARAKTQNIVNVLRWTQTYGVAMNWKPLNNLNLGVMGHFNRYNGVVEQVFAAFTGKFTTKRQAVLDTKGSVPPPSDPLWTKSCHS